VRRFDPVVTTRPAEHTTAFTTMVLQIQKHTHTHTYRYAVKVGKHSHHKVALISDYSYHNENV